MQSALKHNCCIASRLKNIRIEVAISDLLSLTVVHDIEFATGYRVKLCLADAYRVRTLLARWLEEGVLSVE
jgi:hypothetical protein